MDPKEVLNFCLKKGVLLDKEVLNLFSEASDSDSIKIMIEKIKENTHSKIITKKVFTEGMKYFNILPNLDDDKQRSIEKLKIKLGLELEISKEFSNNNNEKQNQEVKTKNNFNVNVSSFTTYTDKKIEASDFTHYFKNRFVKMRSILESHPNLKNLVSINKISGNRAGISIIGIVFSKKITKNGNILLELEDITGRIRILINQNRNSLYKKGEEIALDSVIGVIGSGNNEIIFANDVVFPDSILLERKKSSVEEYAIFIGDLHYGSKLFLRKGFNKFIDYINGKIPNTPEVNKIKYIFIVGDVVAGVGVYPEQEKDLEVKDLEEQFRGIAGFLSKIRKDIAIIITPGNHDGVRLMEPQPILDKKFAWPLYELENVIFATNPCYVNIGSQKGFSGINVLVYHGFSYPYYANTIPHLIQADAMNAPDKIMTYLLKNRHLAPTHSSVQYYPLKEDSLLIDKIPDIFFSGHTHKSGVSFYNNTLIISSATWEDKTLFQEKMGNKPDFCKVPIFNLKTGAIKILDFE